MKKIIITITILVISLFNLSSQVEANNAKQIFNNALKYAMREYRHHYDLHDPHMIITMKLIKIDKISGEFVLSYIMNDYEYIESSHYKYCVYIDNELILIYTNKKERKNIEKYGVKKITEEIKKQVLDALAGPNLVISGQPSPHMLFNYKENMVKGSFFVPHIPKKYWF